jgi:hypothetical protein
MKEFTFNGDWIFDQYLPTLSTLHSDRWFRTEWTADHKAKLLSGYVPFRICDNKTYDPDPTSPQMKAIEYLLNNKEQIIKSLFHNFKYNINEYYAKMYEDYEWIPELNNEDDLGQIIFIENIFILIEHKEEISYCQIDVKYIGDEEHGLAIILHMDRLVGFAGIGDMGYQCIADELGIDTSKESKEMAELRLFGENIVHKPLEKYGKYKPWQLNSTEAYFGKLLREKQNKRLMDEIEATKYDINIRTPELDKNLVDMAAYFNNEEMLDYLIKKGGDYSNSIIQCTIKGFYHPACIKTLVDNGASIDTFQEWGNTPLGYELQYFVRVIISKEKYKNTDQKIYKKTMEEYEQHKQKIRFFIELGANPKALDKKGTNYIDMILTLWSEESIKKYKIIEQVEELIFPKKKNRWKFW